MNRTIVNNSLSPDQLPVNESLFTLANGYLGVRGNFEEGYAPGMPTIQGTYINGFYDIVPMCHAEKQVGDPVEIQKQLNVIDSQGLALFVGEDMEPVTPFNGEIMGYQRFLDMNTGTSTRQYSIRTPKGRELKLTYQRLVSFSTPELFIIKLSVESMGYSGPAYIVSTLNGDVRNHTDDSDPRVASGHSKRLSVTHAHADGHMASVAAEAIGSKLICACNSWVQSPVSAVVASKATRSGVTHTYSFHLMGSVEFTKYAVYTDSLRHTDPLSHGRTLLKTAVSQAFSSYEKLQTIYMTDFWAQSDIEIQGNSEHQDGIRFNLFHLLQASGKDPHCSVAAKGLSGEGYEGHYFWDTEIYILPFFIMTHPELAKNLLMFRSRTLPDALARAKELGHRKGALYPWRTISGKECSGFFPAGTAQYHISGDIAYAFIQYYLATGDVDFIVNHGAEVVFQTARLWMDVGHYKNGQFRIDSVTGPDEYTAIVNNNYYTNAIARYNLRWAVKLKHLMHENHPHALETFMKQSGFDASEFHDFQHAAESMYLPYSSALDIHEQDDSFLNKAPWDFSRNPGDGTPLLLKYHPLTLYRHQVCKQADVVLSHFLLEEGIPDSTLRNSYSYYEAITTFDSSLTACIFSIMASRLDDPLKARSYFTETLRLDLDNTHLNTKDGLHMASMGGTWMALVYGFAGLRISESGISLKPALPRDWTSMHFTLCFKGVQLKIGMTDTELTVSVHGKPTTVFIDGQPYTVEENLPLQHNYLRK